MSENTVYVVGAGASKEANLPTGSELKDQIAKLLDFQFADIQRLLVPGLQQAVGGQILRDAGYLGLRIQPHKIFQALGVIPMAVREKDVAQINTTFGNEVGNFVAEPARVDKDTDMCLGIGNQITVDRI